MNTNLNIIKCNTSLSLVYLVKTQGNYMEFLHFFCYLLIGSIDAQLYCAKHINVALTMPPSRRYMGEREREKRTFFHFYWKKEKHIFFYRFKLLIWYFISWFENCLSIVIQFVISRILNVLQNFMLPCLS